MEIKFTRINYSLKHTNVNNKSILLSTSFRSKNIREFATTF